MTHFRYGLHTYPGVYVKQIVACAAVVTQLAEWSLPIPEVQSSNSCIGKTKHWTYSLLKRRQQKEDVNGAFWTNISIFKIKIKHSGRMLQVMLLVLANESVLFQQIEPGLMLMQF